jgi:putative peptide zinc metalloprotease protein
MEPDPLTADLERRKQVRLRLRRDLVLSAQRYEGCSFCVIKDPISLRYYRFDEYDAFLLRLLDGGHTLDDVQKAFERRFRPRRLELTDLESFGQLLLKSGLVYHELPQAGQQLFDYRRKRRRMEWLQRLTNVLYIEFPLFDPDVILRRLAGRLRWVFTTWSLLGGAALVLGALLLIAGHFATFWASLPSAQEFFGLKNLATLWLAVALVKVFHELGHGVCCKALGGEVHDMGALLMCLTPCLYVNVSDAWALPDKRDRMLVGFAGVYVELLIAAAATFVWWYTPQEVFLHNLCLNLMVVCSVNTLLFNGNPLLRFDGYYVLADWLEVPNLRERCNAYLKRLAMRHALGIEVPPEPPMAPHRRVLFVCYAVASYVYSWVLVFSILWSLSRWLRPYKLGSLSMLLAAASVASMIGWPVYRLLKGVRDRGRLPDMKAGHVAATAALLAACGAAFLVPLPVSRIRQSGLVELRPEADEPVFASVSGTLERLHVRDGERVAAGEVLAELRSLELEGQLAEAQSQLGIRVAQLAALRRQLAGTRDRRDQLRVQVALAEAEGQRQVFARQVALTRKALGYLVVCAPRAGVVLGAPRLEEVGKFWDRDQGVPLCRLGDPGRLRVVVPVSPADYRLLREDLGSRRDPPVTIRVQGCGNQTWRGRVALLPESEARELPLPLTVKGGGPVAARPGPQPNAYVPQTQQYLVTVEFLDSEEGVWPGTRAQVKIHCRWRSAAWWLRRRIASALDLGLL